MHTLVALLDRALGQMLGLERLVGGFCGASVVVVAGRHVVAGGAATAGLESESECGRQDLYRVNLLSLSV